MVSPGAHDAGPVQCQLHLLRGPAVTVLGHDRPVSRKDAALLAVLAMGFWQIRYLRNYFKQKKVI